MPGVGEQRTPSSWDPENVKDPWGGKTKRYRVVNNITNEKIGECNTLQKAHEMRTSVDKNRGLIVDQWQEENTRRLFADRGHDQSQTVQRYKK